MSTTKQGGDGNGIHAQRRDIELFLKQQEDAVVVQEFIEVGCKRSTSSARRSIGRVPSEQMPDPGEQGGSSDKDVERLGRLTKDKNLKIKGHHCKCRQLSDPFVWNLGAQEKQFISQRTRAAMAEAKGNKFGNPRLELNKTRKQKAKLFADEHFDLINNLRKENKTYRQICDFQRI